MDEYINVVKSQFFPILSDLYGSFAEGGQNLQVCR